MSYLRQSNREQNRAQRPTTIIAIFIVILIVVQFLLPNLFPSLIMRMAGPILEAKNTVLSDTQDPSVIGAVYNQDITSAAIEYLRLENAELKSLLGRTPEREDILAVVLSVPPKSPYDTMIVDIGSDNNIQQGKSVYASSTLIGRVTDVYPHTSKIILFSSPGETHEVLLGKDLIRTTATGKGGGVYETIVPRELKLAEGDPVSIPSLYPGVFGVINHIVADPARAFATVYFKAPINLQNLRFVSIER